MNEGLPKCLTIMREGLENGENLTCSLSRLESYFTYLKKNAYSFDCARPLLHARSLVAACELLAVACGIQFSDEGLNLGPLLESTESQPLDHQGSSYSFFLILTGVNSLPAFMPYNFPSSFHSHSNLIKYYHFHVGLCIKVLTVHESRSNRDTHFQNLLVIVNKGPHDFQY